MKDINVFVTSAKVAKMAIGRNPYAVEPVDDVDQGVMVEAISPRIWTKWLRYTGDDATRCFRGFWGRGETPRRPNSRAPRSGPKVKNRRSSTKDGAPERLR